MAERQVQHNSLPSAAAADTLSALTNVDADACHYQC